MEKSGGIDSWNVWGPIFLLFFFRTDRLIITNWSGSNFSFTIGRWNFTKFQFPPFFLTRFSKESICLTERFLSYCDFSICSSSIGIIFQMFICFYSYIYIHMYIFLCTSLPDFVCFLFAFLLTYVFGSVRFC